RRLLASLLASRRAAARRAFRSRAPSALPARRGLAAPALRCRPFRRAALGGAPLGGRALRGRFAPARRALRRGLPSACARARAALSYGKRRTNTSLARRRPRAVRRA